MIAFWTHCKLLAKLVARGLCAGALALTAAGPASAATSLTPPNFTCAAPLPTQAFSAYSDPNWYFLVPGQTGSAFTGDGWTLSGGARIVSTTRADGTTGQVLDLPSGSQAVSPTVCIQSNYPRARSMVRNVKGSEGVFFYVSYYGTSTWNSPKNTGQFHGTGTAWTAGDPINLQPSNVTGWQAVRFTFKPGGTTSDFQVYNFYVDPFRL